MENFYSHPTGLITWIARFIQAISAIIVLGITAWAARDTKTVTVIYCLIIVCTRLPYISSSNNDSGCLDRGDSPFCNWYELHIATP